MYKHQVKRENVKEEFSDIEDYLASLELKMTIYQDDEEIIPRMSQMSQKTNQFNLKTKRYTESDIKNYIISEDSKVIAFSVSDKYGDSGITGLCILDIDDSIQTAEIDTYLMSCRIIGRNIEYAFMDYLITLIERNKINIVQAKYIKTQKNEQVKDFYNNCGFNLIDRNESERTYELDSINYVPKNLKYIGIVNG